jgi:hypothetical protein
MPHATDQPSHRPARVHVDRIGTAPMATQHREQAVSALATLIAAWQQDPTPDEERPGADFAAPLPLPGPASDTDHAA